MTSKKWTLFKTDLFIISSSGFARPLDSNILILILCLVIVAFCKQQHVDCKIADALLKKGTKQHADGWDASSKAWAHMVLHMPHAGFGMNFNDSSKDAVFYTHQFFFAE
jgi:hypothetical protein